MSELTPRMRDFLEALAAHKGMVRPSILRRVADRSEDRARQACRRAGYAEWGCGPYHQPHQPAGWAITKSGRAVLAEQASQVHPTPQSDKGASATGPHPLAEKA